MLVVAIGLIAILLGIVVVVTVPWKPKRGVMLLDALGMISAAFGLLWISSLLTAGTLMSQVTGSIAFALAPQS
jgi:hypothetical protein